MISVERLIEWLIKFGKKENMEKLQNGQLFMHNLPYYINLEKDMKDQIAGDKYEGKLPIKDVRVSIMDPVTHNEEMLLSSKMASFDFGMSKFPVFCFLMFDNRNRLAEIEEEPAVENGERYVTLKYRFSEVQRQEMIKFGDTAVIITDVSEFIKRVKEAAKERNVAVGYGPVNYYCDNDKEHLKHVIEQPGAAPLWKRERYKNQREYRFYLNMEIDDVLVLNIGDIHDISEIVKATDLLNGVICVKAKIEDLPDSI